MDDWEASDDYDSEGENDAPSLTDEEVGLFLCLWAVIVY